jgi:putative DNA primase/helicase
MSWGGSGTPGLFTEGSSAMLRAALNYAARGWRVFPVWGVRDAGACRCGDPACPRAGKHPIGAAAPRGLHDASSDALLVREWWAAHPEANIGIATGLAAGLVVVDVDPGGEESLAALEAEYGRLPPHA